MCPLRQRSDFTNWCAAACLPRNSQQQQKTRHNTQYRPHPASGQWGRCTGCWWKTGQRSGRWLWQICWHPVSIRLAWAVGRGLCSTSPPEQCRSTGQSSTWSPSGSQCRAWCTALHRLRPARSPVWLSVWLRQLGYMHPGGNKAVTCRVVIERIAGNGRQRNGSQRKRA